MPITADPELRPSEAAGGVHALPWVALWTVIGLVLRTYRIGFQSLWIDEVLTAQNAAGSLRHVLLDSQVDRNFPPLHNALVNLSTTSLGWSETALRLPSLVAGTLSIPLLYTVARPWLGARGALLATALLAVSPLHIWYSQEARSYALLICFGLLSVCFARRVLERPGGLLPNAAFVLSAAATFYSHVVAVPFLVALGLWVCRRAARTERLRWVLRWAVVGLLALPQVLRFLSAPPDVSANPTYRFSPAHVGYTVWAFGTGYSLGPSLLDLRQGATALRPHLALMVPILAVLLLLSLLGLQRLRSLRKGGSGELLVWLVVPVAFAVAGTLFSTHPYNVRYTLLALPVFFMLLAAGIEGLSRPYLRIASVVVLVAVSGTALANYYFDPAYQRENNRDAARYINAAADSGGLVIASAPYTVIALRYYSLRPDLHLVPFPRGETLPPDLAGALDSIVGPRRRVWLFLSRTFHSDPKGEIQRYFDSHFAREKEFVAAGVRVEQYRRPAR